MSRQFAAIILMAAVLAPAGASGTAPAGTSPTTAPVRAATGPAALPCVRSAGWLMKDTPQATSYTVIQSPQAGPTVIVVAGLGKGQAGAAAAAEQIAAWSIRRGKLIVLPQANELAAIQPTASAAATLPAAPVISRSFPTSSREHPAEPLAAAVWEFVRANRPDWLIVLWEDDQAKAAPKAGPNRLLVGGDEPARQTASRMAEAVNATITDPADRFALRESPPIRTSLARSAWDVLRVRSMTVAADRADGRVFLRARRDRVLVHRLLTELGMDAHGSDVLVRRAGREILVAIYDDTGSKPPSRLDAKIAAGGDCAACRIAGDDIEAGLLGQFDVLVVPGGSAGGESRELGAAGRAAIRQFVRDGGGYVGMCAGAYLASTDFKNSLDILKARVVGGQRGRATLKIELTPEGAAIVGRRDGPFDVFYANGPVWRAMPDCTVLAHFRSQPPVDPAKSATPRAPMEGSPAIVCNAYGKGRVICTSPHPESTAGLEEFYRRMVRWAAGR